MIKAIEAYKIMCDAIMLSKDNDVDPVAYTIEAIESCIKREAENCLQHTFYDVGYLKDDQIKEVLKIVRNEGYLAMRKGNVLDIQW